MASFCECSRTTEAALIDRFIQTLTEKNIAPFSSLYLFTEFKTVFGRSAYLHQLHNVKYRHILANLRLSSHKLNIEIGRHNTIDRQDRTCIRCNLNDIEDEFHFVLVCQECINLRNAYIPNYYSNRPSVLKFIELVQTNNTSLLIKLSFIVLKLLH